MTTGRTPCAVLLACVCAGSLWAQNATLSLSSRPVPTTPETITLSVPAGTVLQVAVEKEERIRTVGQPIRGLLVQPVYVYDREVLPVGTVVTGRIVRIEGVSGGRRALAILDTDFTPAPKIEVAFDALSLPDGRQLAISTAVTPGSGQPLRLATTGDNSKKKTAKDAASEKMKQAVEEAKRRWNSAVDQIKKPGRGQRFKRYVFAQLPARPHYIDAGTVYFAELQEPLDLGSGPPLNTETTADPPPLPCNLLAHAQLVTPLTSATAQTDAPVEAVLTEPLFAGHRLLFPAGSRLKGSVVRARPARSLHRNGKLHILFHELVPPDGAQFPVDANLEGVQTDNAQRVKLGPEGGAQSTSPPDRYLKTGVVAALAFASYQDVDPEEGDSVSGSASRRAAGGAGGFRLIGILLGTFVHSRQLGLGMGLYGLGRSVHSNFLGHGREVVFPKGTAMEIGVWLSRTCADAPESAPQ